DHHQDLALLRASQQTLVGPVQRLAVDILLQQAFAHDQAQVLARTPPGCVGRLVDNMAQVIQSAGVGWLAGRKPVLARLAALPGTRRKPENLDLDAAPFERPRENISASRSNGDRPTAHRAGVIKQQRDDRVTELSILLGLE